MGIKQRLNFLGWPYLKPPWGLAAVSQVQADKSAADHQIDKYYLPDLGATERDPEMHMLMSHCLRNQITPEALKRMHRRHLLYIAAHSGEVIYLASEFDADGKPIPDKPPKPVPARNPKLQENAVRAKYELERRDRRNAAIFTTFIAAAIAGLVVGLLT